MIRKFVSSPITILFIIYLLAYGLMIFNAGVWEDDWCLYNMSNDGIKECFTDQGMFYLSSIHIFMQHIGIFPPVAYHVLTFILYFSTSVLLYKTLPYLKTDRNTQFILTALFAVLPVNFARIYMMNFQYTLGIFLCFAGLYFFTLAYYKRKLVFRLFSLIACVFSFFLLPSTFVFIPAYIAFVIMLNVIHFTRPITKNLHFIVKQAFKYSDFIILTIVSWLCYSIFTKSAGLHAEVAYYSFKWGFILASPFYIGLSFIEIVLYLADFSNNKFLLVIEI